MKDLVISGKALSPCQKTPMLGAATRQSLGCVCLMCMAWVFAMAPAQAEPRSIEDCEKIQAADAYNQCLAAFGPVAHEHGVTADPEGAAGGRSEGPVSHSEAVPASGHRRGGGRAWRGQSPYHASRHYDPWENMRHAGRHHIEFTIK